MYVKQGYFRAPPLFPFIHDNHFGYPLLASSLCASLFYQGTFPLQSLAFFLSCCNDSSSGGCSPTQPPRDHLSDRVALTVRSHPERNNARSACRAETREVHTNNPVTAKPTFLLQYA